MTAIGSAVVNAMICITICVVCLCRIDKLHGAQPIDKWKVGSQYIIMMLAAAASAMSPWLWKPVGWIGCAMSGAVLYMLAMDASNWDNGPPSSVRMKPHAPVPSSVRVTMREAMEPFRDAWRKLRYLIKGRDNGQG